MLVECRRCGAPLAVKRRARRTKCRYCGAVDERERMPRIAEETPHDFRPPKVWTPSKERGEIGGKELKYKREPGPLFTVAVAVLIVVVSVGAPMLWESSLWDTPPEAIVHASLVGDHATVAKRLHGKVTSATQIDVPLRGDRYERLVLRYAKPADTAPSHLSLDLRHGQKADPAARAILSRRLNGGLAGEYWTWDDARIWCGAGLGADLGSGPLRARRADAAWALLAGAAFDPTVAPSADEMRAVFGGGYPWADLAKLSPATPIDQAKAKVISLFPGAVVEATAQMNATIAVDHPFIRAARIGWFASVGGTVRDVSFETNPALRPKVDAFAQCLKPALGEPRVTIVNPVTGTKSYSFYPGNAQLDLSQSLSLSASGAHGVPTTVDPATWQAIVRAIDRCRA